ncbi:MAG: ABC transporter permease subunit [Bacteroidia bacterium]
MKPIWIIAKRELQAFFDSLTAYILLVLFLAFCGFFTWLGFTDVFLSKQASLRPFFFIGAYWSLFIFIPAITMKMVAEERRSGTLELLLTKSVTHRQIILGKFLGGLMLICIALLFTLPYVITISSIGNLDGGATFSGYLGLVLMSAAYLGIGLFASSLTDNQIVAFLLALSIGILFHWFFGLIASGSGGFVAEVFSGLDMHYHFESIARGVIDLKDIAYFLSIAFGGVLLSEVLLNKHNIRTN